MKTSKIALIVATATALFAGQAIAETAIETSIGQSKVTLDPLTEKDTSFSVGLVKDYGNGIFTEAGYKNHGKMDIMGVASIKAYSFYAGVGYQVPVNEQFSLNGRIGTHAHEVKASFNGMTESDQGMDVYYGIGAKYHLDKKTAIGVNWTEFLIENSKIRGVDVSLTYKF